jgi:putative flippase GtrA
MGAVAGGGIDFALKRWWAFERPQLQTATRSLAREALRYAVVSGLSAVWYGVAVWALVEHARWSLASAVVGGSVLVGVLWNYPLHRLFVFASPPSHHSA